MIEIHKKLRDMSSTDADIKFLKLASTLPMYGTHYYPAFEWIFVSKCLKVSNLFQGVVYESPNYTIKITCHVVADPGGVWGMHPPSPALYNNVFDE